MGSAMKSVLKKVITALIVAGIYFGWALLFYHLHEGWRYFSFLKVEHGTRKDFKSFSNVRDRYKISYSVSEYTRKRITLTNISASNDSTFDNVSMTRVLLKSNCNICKSSFIFKQYVGIPTVFLRPWYTYDILSTQ